MSKDYSKIDNPYNQYLERTDGGIFQDVANAGNNIGGNVSVNSNGNSTSNTSNSSPSSVVNNQNQAAPVITSGNSFNDVWISSFIKSQNYQPKNQGFLIDGSNGYVECMKLYVGNGGIVGGSLDIPDRTSTASFHVDALGNIWSGATTFASAPFSVSNVGALTAESGLIGGWTISDVSLSATSIILDASNQRIQVGSSAPIIIDGSAKEIESDNYVSGVAGTGFHLDSNLLEVGNITARGMIRTAVFQRNVISSVGGSFMVVDCDVLDEDMVSGA